MATPDTGSALPLPPRRRPLRRGTALLPSLFTVANMGLGWFAIQQTLLALHAVATPSTVSPTLNLDIAAKAIGWAVLVDFLDGSVARMANATSEFGREFDSLADIISFGVAPALLAFTWGLAFLHLGTAWQHGLGHAAQILLFLYVVAGAARLARFNISSSDTLPSNPGKPGKRYFVGMPIPAAAGTLAAVVHFFCSPNLGWQRQMVNTTAAGAIAWLALVLLLSYFMVSTWRFPSLKGIDPRRRHPFVVTLLLALLLAGLWLFSEVVLLAIVVLYTAIAVVWRLKFRLWRPALGH